MIEDFCGNWKGKGNDTFDEKVEENIRVEKKKWYWMEYDGGRKQKKGWYKKIIYISLKKKLKKKELFMKDICGDWWKEIECKKINGTVWWEVKNVTKNIIGKIKSHYIGQQKKK